MKTTLLYAKLQLFRVLRDPITLIVLFSIPLLLLLIFGLFTGGTNDNITLKVAVINNSEQAFANEFEKQLDNVKVLKQPEGALNLDQAKDKMKEGELDAIVELPKSFGEVSGNTPTGKIQVIVDQSDMSTGDIMMGVMNSVAEATNVSLTGAAAPIQVERQSISGTSTRIFDSLYSMFTAMGIMMVGIFGVASTIPSDKKTGILRRMRVTPFKTSQLVGGVTLAFLAISLMAITLMTLLAFLGFNMKMQGSWIDFALFVTLGSLLMIALGVMVGGWAKNTTQSDIYGQIIFLASLAFSGLWVPRALMPEWLQGITAYFPLTPLIEGIQRIVIDGASITALGFQLAVMIGWFVVVFVVSSKTFRWE